MSPRNIPTTAPFTSTYFPLHVALLSVGENFFPMAHWMVVSKEPFRLIIAVGVGNHSLSLIKKYKEAALNFMPWSDRQRVIHAGHISGRKVKKAETLGYNLLPAQELKNTKLVEGAEITYEMRVHTELFNVSREFIPFIMNVIAVHGDIPPQKREPILYLSQEDFATLGERWEYHSSRAQ